MENCEGLPTQLPYFLEIESYKNKEEFILLLESSAISRYEFLKNSEKNQKHVSSD